MLSLYVSRTNSVMSPAVEHDADTIGGRPREKARHAARRHFEKQISGLVFIRSHTPFAPNLITTSDPDYGPDRNLEMDIRPGSAVRTSATRRRNLWLLVLPLLSACGGLRVEDQAGLGPPLDLYEFFNGETEAWGLVQDWRGRVVRQFVASIDGQVVNGELVLDEVFRYGTGERETRRWKIRRQSDNKLRGTANDIVGEATGRTHGNAMMWRYEMDIETRGKKVRVRFDDRLWQIDGDTLINRAAIKKFGVTVAEVTLFMRKSSPGA